MYWVLYEQSVLRAHVDAFQIGEKLQAMDEINRHARDVVRHLHSAHDVEIGRHFVPLLPLPRPL